MMMGKQPASERAKGLAQQRAQQLLIVAAAAMESRSRKALMTFPKAFPKKLSKL
jgi:hypothetical protein